MQKNSEQLANNNRAKWEYVFWIVIVVLNSQFKKKKVKNLSPFSAGSFYKTNDAPLLFSALLVYILV